MTTRETDPSVNAVRRHLAAGNMPALRDALLGLSDDGRRQLEQRLGERAVQRLLEGMRRARRAKQGRVVLIHGIMGGKLATVDARGDEDLVWVNYPRLVLGRIEGFRLDEDGNQSDPNLGVVTQGLLDEYLPMVGELDRVWEVLPFAFDWRLDIDESARRLQDAIEAWSDKEPVHIVAHSMGGLVSRQFIKRFPETWGRMADPDGLHRGGRLVMLGTPNRGSFAIPLVMTGVEKTVRVLELFDLKHNLAELLAITNTFPGSYQMMPSPKLDFGDDRVRLFSTKTWGTYPVTAANLDRGRRFQEGLDAVDSPERLVYVAGYDQATPYRIRVDGPGDFSYQETQDGDGRVPHELGRLPSVRMFYVREKHGDLPRNDQVLTAIHDLLRDGTSTALEPELPPSRRGPDMRPRWRKAVEISPVPEDVAALLAPRGRRARKEATPEQRTLLESRLVEDIVGGARGMPSAAQRLPAIASTSASGARKRPGESPGPRAGHTIKIEVVWGDIRQVRGDVYAAGHYQGVLPQRGEYALDRVVSFNDPDTEGHDEALVITGLTRRGVLRGALGDVNFYPWANPKHRRRIVAIAGMGYPGTFGRLELRRLARSLTDAVSALPNIRTVNMLLIGSGAGNLSVDTALEELLRGMGESLAGGTPASLCNKVRIVERERTQAQRIADALASLKLEKLAPTKSIALAAVPGVVPGAGGRVSNDLALSAFLVAAAAAKGTGRGRSETRRKAVDTLLRALPEKAEVRRRCQEALADLAKGSSTDLLEGAAKLDFSSGAKADSRTEVPTRVSFIHDDGGLRAAALTNTAVVPERFVAVDWTLIEQMIQNMTDPPDLAQIPDMSALLARFVIPRDFRELFSSSESTIFEVDRKTARIHWEMLGLVRDRNSDVSPIGLESLVARQLRTQYSATPSSATEPGARLRALVIGDPGDPSKNQSLTGARREALAVIDLLRARAVDVVALIGAEPSTHNRGLAEFGPATRLEVLRLLNQNRFDLLHYAGHGDFDPTDPQGRAGWVFADGLLGSRELERVDTVPNLIVANACLSSLTSDAYATAQPAKSGQAEHDLLPGLADEFFMRGARNYVGTAWEVSDLGAILFAETLYGSLIPDSRAGAGGKTLGEAVFDARRVLKQNDAKFGALWAAYQHYGDPAYRLAPTPVRAPQT